MPGPGYYISNNSTLINKPTTKMGKANRDTFGK